MRGDDSPRSRSCRSAKPAPGSSTRSDHAVRIRRVSNGDSTVAVLGEAVQSAAGHGYGERTELCGELLGARCARVAAIVARRQLRVASPSASVRAEAFDLANTSGTGGGTRTPLRAARGISAKRKPAKRTSPGMPPGREQKSEFVWLAALTSCQPVARNPAHLRGRLRFQLGSQEQSPRRHHRYAEHLRSLRKPLTPSAHSTPRSGGEASSFASSFWAPELGEMNYTEALSIRDAIA